MGSNTKKVFDVIQNLDKQGANYSDMGYRGPCVIFSVYYLKLCSISVLGQNIKILPYDIQNRVLQTA